MIRLAIVAPQFPEYSLRYAMGMAPLCNVMACIDEGQLAAEYAGRALPARKAGRMTPVRFKTLLDLVRLLWLVRRFRPNIVHIQEASGPRRAFFTACVAWLMRSSALIVLTVHDPLPHAGRDQAAARRTTRIGAYVRRAADLIVVHGEYCARTLRDNLPGSPAPIVPSEHGLILEPDLVLPAPGGRPKFYVFGRMEAYKGLGVLLEAAERLHAEGFPFELTVAGSGPELNMLQARFTRLPGVDVFNGFVPPGAVTAAIQAADCVLLPYLNATQSGVLAAAFAGRRTVIASATGGLPDVVTHGQNGLLVPPGDAAALAAAIRSLSDDPALLARLQAGAEATAAGQLNWNRIAAALFAVFKQSMAKRGRRPSRSA